LLSYQISSVRFLKKKVEISSLNLKRLILNRFPTKSVKLFMEQQAADETTLIITYSQEDFLFPVDGVIEQFSDRKLARGMGIDNLSWILSYSEIAYFQQYEGFFLSIASRFDIEGINFLNEEKADLYYSLINFWISKLKTHKIDTVFHYHAPHDTSSFVLHLVSKHLGLTTLWPDMPVIMHTYRYFTCSFSNRNLLLSYGKDGIGDLESIFSRFANAIRSKSAEAVPPDIIMFTKLYQNGTNNILKKTLLVINIINEIIPISLRQLLNRKLVWKKSQTWWKRSRDKYSGESSDYSYYGFLLSRYAHRIKIVLMRWRYRKLCSDHNKVGKFVYFAAPLQPEAATLPAALHAGRVYPLLRMISDALPLGIVLLYKENGWLFSELSYGSFNWKKRFFYEELRELGNVKFVREDVATLDLIDASVGVACVNGTVAVESVMLGKYCMTVAPNWYDGLDGILRVSTPDDARGAIKKMLTASAPNPVASQLSVKSNFFEFEEHYALTDNDDKGLFIAFRKAYETFQLLGPEKFAI
jgi:hypothetical protein